VSTNTEKLLAARDLLVSTKRTLQLVDGAIDNIKKGRVAIAPPSDMSSEHRSAWFGAVDDNDNGNGILLSAGFAGFGNPFTGTIRIQEDAAFVCTRILVAARASDTVGLNFQENVLRALPPVMLSLKDGNTGRNLTPGLSTGPADKDRGAVPLSVLTSTRTGAGASYKNPLFSEFTIPRAGTVRVTAWNMAEAPATRLFISLFGYKVFGG
jgi:hypothetical protein